MLGGLIGFTAPMLLAGLAALPVIWWLLRLTPPAPARIAFPPARMLEGLRPPERTPERSPWWLTALRMLAATFIILALAGPLYNPNLVGLPSGRPVLLVIDNGWAAASRWSERQKLIAEIIQRAESDRQPIYLAPTAGLNASWRLEPLTPEKARSMAQTLAPVPAWSEHDRMAAALRQGIAQAGGLNVIWLSDGIATPGREALGEVLRTLASGGELRIAEDSSDRAALALAADVSADKKLTARIANPAGAARQGLVHAINARGERLGEVAFAFSAGQTETTASFNLPLELQNQVARLEIAREASAGAVYLLDARALRHRVGVISSDAATGSQPLLSPTHYIEKALTPFADVLLAPTGNLDEATEFLLTRKPTVMVMADIGRIVGPVEQRLRQWVEAGGLLVRFAGERMEQGGDTLLPVRLREGGRTLGGALSWSTPQKLGPFETSSIFHGLTIPDDVTVSRQILADPAAIGPQSQIWARLTDGTPLVTAAPLGKGRVVLFHIPGTPDWSNLPISGVFVEMFRIMLEKSAALGIGGGEAGAETARDMQARDRASSFLAPHLTLNGFGKLGTPPPHIRPLPLDGFDGITPTAETPPGYYGEAGEIRSLNILKPGVMIKAAPSAGSASLDYRQDASLALAPFLYLAALVVFMIDALVTTLMLSGGRMRRGLASAASLAALAGITALLTLPGQAEPARAQTSEAEANPPLATMQGALQTRLAYVITGDERLDSISKAGLAGLSRVLAARTAIEPAEPMGVDVVRDELSVFPLLYWPVPDAPTALSDAVIAKIDAFMKSGGMIVFDTRDYLTPLKGLRDGSLDFGATPLGTLLAKLDVPRLEPVSGEHVVTKSFYILRGFPGRWDGGELWVEAQTNISDMQTRRALKSDGVSSILVTSNDMAAAWALDENNRPLFPVVPGGEEQRETAFRAGVNIVMYALTGNYKADQVHVPALLERLGH
jgi:hypothetical protein